MLACEKANRHERCRPPLPDHHACRRRGRAHALRPAQGAARARRAARCSAHGLAAVRESGDGRYSRRRRAGPRRCRGRGAQGRAGRGDLRPAGAARHRRTPCWRPARRSRAATTTIVVVYADTPLIRGATLAAMRAGLADGAAVVGAWLPPRRSGRLRPADRARGAAHRHPRAQGREPHEVTRAAVQRRTHRLRWRRGAEPARRGHAEQRAEGILPDRHRRDRPCARPHARSLAVEASGGDGRQRPGFNSPPRRPRCRGGSGGAR